MWDALSDERTGLSFTTAAGPRQCSHSQARVPRDLRPCCTVSDSTLPQPGGPGSRIYIPQEQGDQVTPPGTGFPSRRLLRLAGLRWRYSSLPPHGMTDSLLTCPAYNIFARTAQKTLFLCFSSNAASVSLRLPVFSRLSNCLNDRDVAQAVSRWLPIAAARVRVRAACGV
jgi:hypothetical protein